jgi:hypothetical protein
VLPGNNARFDVVGFKFNRVTVALVMESSYVYEPLNEVRKQIRLVRIDKAKPRERIQCTLRRVSMKLKPKYVALSYTWDNPFGKADQPEEHGEDIVINKRPFHTAKTLPVRYNLACALRTLPHGISDWYWIDAICLNQSDVAERNKQVLRMGEIYSEAKKVIAWLGPASDNSSLAFDLIRHTADCYIASNDSDDSNELEVGRWIESTWTDEACYDSWRAFVSLLHRTWWRRTWVLQETTQAKDLELWCGKVQLDWLIIERAFFVLTGYHAVEVSERFAPAGASDQVYDAFDAFNAICSRIGTRQRIFQAEPTPLLSMLELTRSHLATDNRDKLFAMLSLAHKDERDLIVVDYNISVRALYISFARRYIEATGDLQIITLAHENDPANFPSWVPDWSQRRDIVPLSLVLRTGWDSDMEYCAHKGKYSSCRFSDKLESLLCQGVRFDNVDGLGTYDYAGVDLEDSEAVQSSTVKSAYGSAEATFEAIWRSACGNVEMFQDQWEILGDFGAHFAKLWSGVTAGEAQAFESTVSKRVVRFLSEAGVLRLGGRTIHDLVLKASESLEATEESDVMQERWVSIPPGIHTKMGGCRFLITQQGYVGWAPRRTRKGDKIFVLLGCRTPVILRPQGDSFRLIGECYIHGVMNGEVIDELEAGKYQLQDVTIV